jgi:hypothetical protein
MDMPAMDVRGRVVGQCADWYTSVHLAGYGEVQQLWWHIALAVAKFSLAKCSQVRTLTGQFLRDH